jgi:hypothetical protein
MPESNPTFATSIDEKNDLGRKLDRGGLADRRGCDIGQRRRSQPKSCGLEAARAKSIVLPAQSGGACGALGCSHHHLLGFQQRRRYLNLLAVQLSLMIEMSDKMRQFPVARQAALPCVPWD